MANPVHCALASLIECEVTRREWSDHLFGETRTGIPDRLFATRHGRVAGPNRRTRNRARWFLAGLALATAAFVACVADAYYQSYRIYQRLETIPARLSSAQASLANGVMPAGDPLGEVSRAARGARDAVEDARFTFGLVGGLPFVGRPVDAVRLATSAAGEEAAAGLIVRDIVLDLLGEDAMEGTVGEGSAPVFANGVADVDLLAGLAPRLDALIDHLLAADRNIRAVPRIPLVPGLDELKEEALTRSAEAIVLVRRARSVTGLIPGFLGGDGPRTYFLALQQNAALRGTGGTVLAYAFVEARAGRLGLIGGGGIRQIDPVEGTHVQLPTSIRWYLNAAGVRPRIANGVNYSPDFPVVAETWADQVRVRTGRAADGVIAVDPIGIARLLEGVGPITVASFPGPITADNLVDVVMNRQFSLPEEQQAALAGELIGAAFRRLTDGSDFLPMLGRMGAALAEKRIQVWTADPSQRALVAELGWDGSLRPGVGDYVNLVQENRLTNKIDYFGRQEIAYTVNVRAEGDIQSTYEVTLRNEVPSRPAYFGQGNADRTRINRAMMNLYVPGRAQIGRVSPAEPAPLEHQEAPFRVVSQTLEAAPGRQAVMKVAYSVPDVIRATAEGHVYELSVQHQPLAVPADLTVTVTFPRGTDIRSAPGWRVDGNRAVLSVTLTRDFVARIEY